MAAQDEPAPQAAAESDEPPAFASWRGLYAAALVSALVVMLLIAAFSRFGF